MPVHDEKLLWEYLKSYDYDYFMETLIPSYCHYPELLEKAILGVETNEWDYIWYQDRRITALKILQIMPTKKIPQSLLDIVWEYAVGDAKTHRLDAQQIIERFPEKLPQIADQLRSSKSATRAVAAEWLGRMRRPETLDALQKAFEKEKIDATRVEMMKALVAFGVSLEKLLDHDQLLKESAAGLKKGIPKQLAWFPFGHLPTLHWIDNGEPVAAEIVQWWLVQSVKLKSPEPSPLLTLYGETIRQPEREAFAKFVLNSWIVQDTKLPTEEEFQERLQSPNYYLPPQNSSFYQQFCDSIRNFPIGSANDSKGLLAVVAAWGNAEVAPIMEKYIRDWYGNRVHQSRALVVALGAMDQMAATQALLGISRKMKTKSIREEAENAVRKLAERRNWTLDQLADRTVPTAELDASGTLTLDLGARQLTTRWEKEPKLTLYDPQGKTLKSFPTENKSDEPEKYKEAKASYQSAGKILKTVVTQQSDRLYEAMCMQRTWPLEEWTMFLLEHPIVGRLCQRLVWEMLDESGNSIATFRPMEDGTLTDNADNSMTIPKESTGQVVRLAHALIVPPDVVAAWLEHLNDYEIKPLFSQFGTKPYTLPETQRNETAINDFHGVKVEAFKLRNAATKLGFVRGEIGDGGWFYDYVKSFPGAELVAAIEFSGNGLPEENITVELDKLCFRMKRQQQPIKLANVPAVLLNEMYRAMEAMTQ